MSTQNQYPQRYVCARCGCNVGYWFFGWKHQTGGYKSRPTCGLKPIPVKEKQ